MQTERRQSSPEYRERVNEEALVIARCGDYELAVGRAEYRVRMDRSSFNLDVLSLLRRRAETVKGMRV